MAHNDMNTVMRQYDQLQRETEANFSRFSTSPVRSSEESPTSNRSGSVMARKNTTQKSLFDKFLAFLCCGSTSSLDEPIQKPRFTPGASEKPAVHSRFPSHIPESSSVYSDRPIRATRPTHIPESSSVYSERPIRVSPPPPSSVYSTHQPTPHPPVRPPIPDYWRSEAAPPPVPPRGSDPPPPPPAAPSRRRSKYQFESETDSEAGDTINERLRLAIEQGNPFARERQAREEAQRAAALAAEEFERGRQAREYKEKLMRKWAAMAPPPRT